MAFSRVKLRRVYVIPEFVHYPEVNDIDLPIECKQKVHISESH